MASEAKIKKTDPSDLGIVDRCEARGLFGPFGVNPDTIGVARLQSNICGLATRDVVGLTFVILKRDPFGAAFNFRSMKEMRFSIPPSRLEEALLFFQPVMLI